MPGNNQISKQREHQDVVILRVRDPGVPFRQTGQRKPLSQVLKYKESPSDICPQAEEWVNSIWKSQDAGASLSCSRKGKEAGGQGLSGPQRDRKTNRARLHGPPGREARQLDFIEGRRSGDGEDRVG